MILQRVDCYARQNSFHQHLAEIGRVYKTIHSLRTLDDEGIGGALIRELNKGEASHDLSRSFCFGEEGALRGREFGDQLHTFSWSLTMLWLHGTRLHIGELISQLWTEGQSN